jgi:histone H3/H4
MNLKNISDSEKRDLNQLSRATNRVGLGDMIQKLIPVINELTGEKPTTLHEHVIHSAEEPPTNSEIATLTTTLEGTNNDLVYTSKLDGAAGNKIKIAYVDPDEEEAELGISFAVSEGITTITVNLATNESKVITTKASDVKAAIDAHPVAKTLVSVANAADNSGAGAVTALTATALAGGVDGTPAPVGTIIYNGGKLYVATAKVGIAGATWGSIELTDGGYTPAHNHVLFADNAPTNTAIATLTTSLTGANNDLVYTSKADGAIGNKIKIAYVKPDAKDAILKVVPTTANGVTTITVNLATDEDKAITTTAEDIKTAIDSNPESLVYVDLAEDNDGKGVVTELTATALQGGVDGTPAPVGSFIVHDGTLYIATGKVGTSGATWSSIELTEVT